MAGRFIVATAGCTTLFILSACQATSDGEYPDRDVTVVVPYDAGGNGDTTARALTPCLAEESGHTFVVENTPGAAGTVGTRDVANATPDGYTISVNAISATVVAPNISDTGYATTDLAVVAVPYTTPLILWVADDGPASFTDLAGASQEEEVTIAVPGTNSMQDIATRTMVEKSLIAARVVPTDSNAEIARGVLAGDYSAGLTAVSLDYLPRIESGEMRVLAVSGDAPPSYLFPDTPTFADVGIGDLLPTLSIDIPVVVPSDTPQDVQNTLTELFRTCLAQEEVREGIGPFVPTTFREPAEVSATYSELASAISAISGE